MVNACVCCLMKNAYSSICYRGPRIDGTNGTSTKMASMKFQPHMLVQCVPSIGSRQYAKKSAICSDLEKPS